MKNIYNMPASIAQEIVEDVKTIPCEGVATPTVISAEMEYIVDKDHWFGDSVVITVNIGDDNGNQVMVDGGEFQPFYEYNTQEFFDVIDSSDALRTIVTDEVADVKGLTKVLGYKTRYCPLDVYPQPWVNIDVDYEFVCEDGSVDQRTVTCGMSAIDFCARLSEVG